MLSAELPWQRTAPGLRVDGRMDARLNMYVAAILIVDGRASPVKIRNLSKTGALIDASVLPEPGARVRIVRGELHEEAHVVWRSDRCCGLQFGGAVDVRAWLASRDSSHQQRVDEVVRLVRAGKLTAPAPSDIVLSRPPIPIDADTEALHDVVMEIAATLQQVSEEFADDTSILVTHSKKIQILDTLAARLNAIAGTVPAKTAAEPVALIA